MNLTYYEKLSLLHCYKCGVAFGITESQEVFLRRQQTDFFCPNGHPQAFIGKTDAQKLAEAKAELEMKEAQLRREREATAAVSRRLERAHRKLKRVSNGVCPECNRSFTNLRRHMECKHRGKKA